MIQNIQAEERVAEEEEIFVEEVDDRPEPDRVAARDPKGADFDIPEEEIAQYSENVQKRIKQLKYEFHEERREKEAAQRQNEEAVKYAQQIMQERDGLRATIAKGNEALYSVTQQKLDTEMTAAEGRYRDAYEEGDTEKIVEAQRGMTEAAVEKKQFEQYKPQEDRVTETDTPSEVPQGQPQVTVDPRAKEWLSKNRWFGNGPDKNVEMTGFAYGVHEELVRSGIDPTSKPDDYYAEVDRRIQDRFPEQFGGVEETREQSPPQPVVASARRSGGNSRKVQLTRSQVDLAKRLGLTKEQYAAQVAKEMAHG
tara:strand:- start:2453 stop:3382 length:930 start_codon:yes stop_codon:yes gene_type:complete